MSPLQERLGPFHLLIYLVYFIYLIERATESEKESGLPYAGPLPKRLLQSGLGHALGQTQMGTHIGQSPKWPLHSLCHSVAQNIHMEEAKDHWSAWKRTGSHRIAGFFFLFLFSSAWHAGSFLAVLLAGKFPYRRWAGRSGVGQMGRFGVWDPER